jgi:hypothetical protein
LRNKQGIPGEKTDRAFPRQFDKSQKAFHLHHPFEQCLSLFDDRNNGEIEKEKNMDWSLELSGSAFSVANNA